MTTDETKILSLLSKRLDDALISPLATLTDIFYKSKKTPSFLVKSIQYVLEYSNKLSTDKL